MSPTAKDATKLCGDVAYFPDIFKVHTVIYLDVNLVTNVISMANFRLIKLFRKKISQRNEIDVDRIFLIC